MSACTVVYIMVDFKLVIVITFRVCTVLPNSAIGSYVLIFPILVWCNIICFHLVWNFTNQFDFDFTTFKPKTNLKYIIIYIVIIFIVHTLPFQGWVRTHCRPFVAGMSVNYGCKLHNVRNGKSMLKNSKVTKYEAVGIKEWAF